MIQKWRVHNESGYQEFTTLEEAEGYATEINSETIELIQEEVTTPSVDPNWSNLLAAIRGSAIFARAYTAGDTYLPAQNALTQVMTAIAVTRELVDFVFFFNRLREVMPQSTAGDYTPEELGAIAQMLTENHFPLDGFNLS